MKLGLISPYPDFRTYGIRSLSTYLRKRGHQASTFYLMRPYSVPYPDSVLERLTELIKDCDLVGISVMSNYYMNAAQITKKIKSKLNVPVVWGGVHSTVMPRESLEHADIAVIGEGEETTLEILEKIRRGEPPVDVAGTFVRRGGRVIENPPRPLIPPGDLPVIDNDYSSDYVIWKGRDILPIDGNILRKCLTRDYMTLTSFGCPFSCAYCINNRLNRMHPGPVRFRKIEDVLEELVRAKSRMPFIKQITFDDDAFISRDGAELKIFAREYRRRVNLPFFVSGVNPVYVSEEKIRILLDAGMNRIKMGIQSGSNKSKLLYNRHISNEKIISSARAINKYRRRMTLVAYDLILDNPFESKKDILETIDLLSRLPSPYTLNLSSLTFFPGTRMYELARAAGYVKDNVRDVYLKLYHGVDNNYLNLIIVLFSIGKVPPRLLKLLTAEKMVKRLNRVPSRIFGFFLLMGFARRGIDFIIKGDPHTLWRLIRYNPLKP